MNTGELLKGEGIPRFSMMYFLARAKKSGRGLRALQNLAEFDAALNRAKRLGVRAALCRFFRTAVLLFAFATSPAFSSGHAPFDIHGRTHSVGLSKIDITPDYPIRLNGYIGRNAESTNTIGRLYAKAIALGSDREKPAILICVDNCIVPHRVYEEVVARLAKRGIAREKLVILVSHSHTAPKLAGAADNIYGMDIPAVDQEHIDRYTKEFTDDLEKVAVAALQDRRPSRLAWGRTSAGFGKNRRTKGGPVDHDVPVLVIVDLHGLLRGLLVNYACHCTTLDGRETRMCGDWAGFAQRDIEEIYPGAIALTAIGCGADQNPDPRPGIEFAERHGHELANAVSNLLAQPLMPLKGKLECRTESFELPLDTLPTRAEFEQRAADPDKTHYPAIYHARKQLARLDRGEQLPTQIPYLVQEWNFGKELLLTFLPGEVVVDYSLRQKNEFDGSRLWANAYANFVPCYIPSKRIWTEGSYEGGGAMIYYDWPTRLSANTETLIFDHLEKIVPKSFRTSANKK
jgi:hypothetical protein